MRFQRMLAVLLAWGVLLSCGNGDTGNPGDAVPSECEAAVAGLAETSRFQDSMEDYDATIRACPSATEWKTTISNNPEVADRIPDLDTFLENRCADSSLASTPTCQSR